MHDCVGPDIFFMIVFVLAPAKILLLGDPDAPDAILLWNLMFPVQYQSLCTVVATTKQRMQH